MVCMYICICRMCASSPKQCAIRATIFTYLLIYTSSSSNVYKHIRSNNFVIAWTIQEYLCMKLQAACDICPPWRIVRRFLKKYRSVQMIWYKISHKTVYITNILQKADFVLNFLWIISSNILFPLSINRNKKKRYTMVWMNSVGMSVNQRMRFYRCLRECIKTICIFNSRRRL